MSIVQALKERSLIDIGAVPAGQGSAGFTGFLFDFFDYDKSAYVRDRLAHGHSIGRRYCGDSTNIIIRRYWAPAFKGRTLGSIIRVSLKTLSLSLPAGLSAAYKNSILNAGLILLGWTYNEGMIPADIGSGFERYAGKSGKRGVLSVEETGILFAKPWAGATAMTANLPAATVGMRKGEILAIRGADIGEAVLRVSRSWSAADKPRYDGYFALIALDKELAAMGVDRRSRNICFRSWRHFYAARMADVEEAEKVSRITGHKSRAVFNAYANHVTEKAVVDLGKTAAAVFAGILAGAALVKGRG